MKRLDSLKLLSIIKKLVYTGSMSNYDMRHNKETALLNLMNLHQEKFQPIQDFRDQYLALKTVCHILELHFGRCESDTRAMYHLVLSPRHSKYPVSTQGPRKVQGHV